MQIWHFGVMFPPVPTTVRIEDDRAAAHDAAVLRGAAAAVADEQLVELLERLAAHVRDGVVLASVGEYLSPAEAGALLGVSRQYVDKLIAAGRLPVSTKPGSSHRRIAVADLIAFEHQRRASLEGAAALVDELLDAGVEY